MLLYVDAAFVGLYVLLDHTRLGTARLDGILAGVGAGGAYAAAVVTTQAAPQHVHPGDSDSRRRSTGAQAAAHRPPHSAPPPADVEGMPTVRVIGPSRHAHGGVRAVPPTTGSVLTSDIIVIYSDCYLQATCLAVPEPGKHSKEDPCERNRHLS